MFAAMIASLGITALAQFALFYGRAVVGGVAKEPLSADLRIAAGLSGSGVSGSDFWSLSGLHRITPALERQENGLRLVSAYFRAVDLLRDSLGRLMPAVGAWSQMEMATCATYVAVVMDRKMKSNVECVAALRSC